MKLRTAVTLAVLVSAFAASSPAEAAPAVTTTIVVVRHADRLDESDTLSEPGVKRAEKLADVLELADRKPHVVLTTALIRTKQTAQPVIERFKTRTVKPYAKTESPDAFNAKDLAKKVLAEYAGKTVLIVGHSGTVASIVNAFAPFDVPAFRKDEYDRMYVITVTTTAKVEESQYGN
jgi:phosphohistidine phosphatase SixA